MKLISLRVIQYSILVLLGAGLIGCASVTMPPPAASASTVEAVRTANLAPSAVGTFSLAAGLSPGMDKYVGLRGSTLSGTNGSFSQQLKETLIAELKGAGLYDEKSQIMIEGQLKDSQLDAAIGTGTAKLAANFTVDKVGKRVFEKTLTVDSQWDSSFVGAIALPEAINQYTSLYKALVAKLFNDKDFRTALAH